MIPGIKIQELSDLPKDCRRQCMNSDSTYLMSIAMGNLAFFPDGSPVAKCQIEASCNEGERKLGRCGLVARVALRDADDVLISTTIFEGGPPLVDRTVFPE